MNTELTWSAFIREPTRIDALLAHGSVVLRRRDGMVVSLVRGDAAPAMPAPVAAAARLLVAIVRDAGSAPSDIAATALPWTRFLPSADRQRFVDELLPTFEACADLGDYSALEVLFAEWKSTALVHAEGHAPALSRPASSPGGIVERPPRPHAEAR